VPRWIKKIWRLERGEYFLRMTKRIDIHWSDVEPEGELTIIQKCWCTAEWGGATITIQVMNWNLMVKIERGHRY
jgi:hypothetical protein